MLLFLITFLCFSFFVILRSVIYLSECSIQSLLNFKNKKEAAFIWNNFLVSSKSHPELRFFNRFFYCSLALLRRVFRNRNNNSLIFYVKKSGFFRKIWTDFSFFIIIYAGFFIQKRRFLCFLKILKGN